MKIILAIFTFCALIESVSANDVWIPYVPQQPPVTLIPPVVEIPVVPAITYSTISRPIVMTHGWVPYVVNRPIVVEKRCLFYRYQYITYQSTIEWVYQPLCR